MNTKKPIEFHDFEGNLIGTLDALEAEQAQAVEPIGYVRHADKTFWPHPECAVYASVSPSLAPVYAHPAPPAEQAQAVEPAFWLNEAGQLSATRGWAERNSPGSKLIPLYTHPAPPAQAQPVATVQCINGVTIGYLDVMQPVGTKLYLHPAQQVAVPMTEAQIFACDPVPHVMFDQQRIDFARAIEAFHGIGAKP